MKFANAVLWRCCYCKHLEESFRDVSWEELERDVQNLAAYYRHIASVLASADRSALSELEPQRSILAVDLIKQECQEVLDKYEINLPRDSEGWLQYQYFSWTPADEDSFNGLRRRLCFQLEEMLTINDRLRLLLTSKMIDLKSQWATVVKVDFEMTVTVVTTSSFRSTRKPEQSPLWTVSSGSRVKNSSSGLKQNAGQISGSRSYLAREDSWNRIRPTSIIWCWSSALGQWTSRKDRIDNFHSNHCRIRTLDCDYTRFVPVGMEEGYSVLYCGSHKPLDTSYRSMCPSCALCNHKISEENHHKRLGPSPEGRDLSSMQASKLYVGDEGFGPFSQQPRIGRDEDDDDDCVGFRRISGATHAKCDFLANIGDWYGRSDPYAFRVKDLLNFQEQSLLPSRSISASTLATWRDAIAHVCGQGSEPNSCQKAEIWQYDECMRGKERLNLESSCGKGSSVCGH